MTNQKKVAEAISVIVDNTKLHVNISSDKLELMLKSTYLHQQRMKMLSHFAQFSHITLPVPEVSKIVDKRTLTYHK